MDASMITDVQRAMKLLAKYAKPRPDGTVWVDQPFKILTTELMMNAKQAQQLIRALTEQRLIESYYPHFKARLMMKQCGEMGINFTIPEKTDEEKEAPKKVDEVDSWIHKTPILPAVPENREAAPVSMRPMEMREDRAHPANEKRGRQSLPQSEIDKIIAAHAEYHGNLTKASNALGRSMITVVKYWRLAGLVAEGKRGISAKVDSQEPRRQFPDEMKPQINMEPRVAEQTAGDIVRCKSLPQDKIDKIIAAHPEYHGVAAKAAEALGHNAMTVSKYWKKAGLVAQGNDKGRQCLPQSEIDKIIAAHAEYGGNVARTVRVLGRSAQSVSKYWKRAGLVANGHSQSIDRCCLPQSEIDKILAAHSDYGGNATKAAEALRRSIPTVVKYWKRAGLAARPKKEAGMQLAAKPALRLIKTESSVADKSAITSLMENQMIRVSVFDVNDSGIGLIKQETMAAFRALSEKLMPSFAESYELLAVKSRTLMMVKNPPGRFGLGLVFEGEGPELDTLKQAALLYARATRRYDEQAKAAVRGGGRQLSHLKN